MIKHSRWYLSALGILGLGFFLFGYQTTRAETTKPTLSITADGSELYTYTTNCQSNALRKTQGFIIPKGVASVDSLYVYFHGTGNPTAETICTTANFALCSETSKLAKNGTNAAVVLNLGYKKDSEAADLNLSQSEMQCFLNEAKEKIGTITKVNASKFSAVGHSMGSNSVLKYLQNGFASEKTIIFDGCWQDRCKKIANLYNSGSMFLYTSKFEGNDVQGQEAAESNTAKVTYLQMTSGASTFQAHMTIPGLCFADHMVKNKCYGKFGTVTISEGTEYGIGKACVENTSDSDCSNGLDCEDSSLDQSKDDFCVCKTAAHCAGAYGTAAGETWKCIDDATDSSYALHYCVSNLKNKIIYPLTLNKGKASATDNASVAKDIASAYNNKTLSEEELKALLQKPKIKIKIPGLNFSDINIEGQLSGDDLGNTYLNIPFLGEYIASLYKYLVVLAGIFCVVRIIIGGFLFTLPDTSGGTKSSGKEMIKQAVMGLVISVSSYVLLYSINPELVQFRNLKVLYTQSNPFPFEDVVVDNESTGYYGGGSTGKGTVAVDAAKTIGGLVQPSSFPACSKEAAQDISKKLTDLNICVGPCHCAFTASRFLSFIGCGNPLHGSAPRLAILLNQKGWIATAITKENGKNLPVGMVYLPGHAGVSIGGGKVFESGTGGLFKKSAKGGSCPETYPDAVNNPGICSYCAKLTPEDPSTGRFGANGVSGGKNGAPSCSDNQGWQESGTARLLNFRVVLWPPGNGQTQPMGCCKIKNKALMSEVLCQQMGKDSKKSELTVTVNGTTKSFFENGKNVATWDSSITSVEACK